MFDRRHLDDDLVDEVSDVDDDVVERGADLAEVDRPLELVRNLAVDFRLEEREHGEPEPHPVGVVGKVTQPGRRLLPEVLHHRLVRQRVVVHKQSEIRN